MKAEYRTQFGLVKSAWRYDGDTWIWDFTVPAGATATVVTPDGKTETRGPGDHQVKCAVK